MALNQVALYGHISYEADVRYTNKGVPAVCWGICVNDVYKNNQTGEWKTSPNFFDCVMFGNSAQNYAPKLKKGTPLIIQGKLHWNKWSDPRSGKNLSKVEIVVSSITFTSKPKKQDGSDVNEVAIDTPTKPTELAEEDFVF